MAKFHVGANGPAPCTATVRACPVGSEDEHYATQAQAQAKFEQTMANEFGTVGASVKRPQAGSWAQDPEEAAAMAFYESEMAGAAEFEEQRAYEQWRQDKLEDDPELSEEELSEEAYSDEQLSRWESYHDV